MSRQDHRFGSILSAFRLVQCLCVFTIFAPLLLIASCNSLERSKESPYFAESPPPAKQEFRWSNGKLPKSFDPALAAAAPETDIIRAVYQGLTITDPKTLEAVPGVAEKWTSSEGGRVWTFQLSNDAKWTTGKNVTARDFVRSWNRLSTLANKAAHPELFRNFARLKPNKSAAEKPESKASETLPTEPVPNHEESRQPAQGVQANTAVTPTTNPQSPDQKTNSAPEPFAVRAESDLTLTLTLETPDPDLPKLVANPMFSPVFGDGSEFLPTEPAIAIVTNGPFRISAVSKAGVVVQRSENFGSRDAIELDTIHFVPAETADDALEAYRSGQVDAVTNAEFEPLAVKLLAPYQDFRKATHGALNLYEFNASKAPFADRRIREALTIAIERERLSDGELEGTTRPAFRFLPFGGKPVTEIVQDVERAKELIAAAGFPDGVGFPIIRLVINRNDTQQRVARAVARMWKQNLGFTTEVVVKETADMESIRKTGEFDLIRRGVIFPTSDVQSNLSAIFDPIDETTANGSSYLRNESQPAPTALRENHESQTPSTDETSHGTSIPTEAEALYQLTAIPLYFPTSYSLVKPYVQGFDPNSLDILSTGDVRIDSNWQPKRPSSES